MVPADIQSKELLCDVAQNFNPSLPTQLMYRVSSIIFSFHPSSFLFPCTLILHSFTSATGQTLILFYIVWTVCFQSGPRESSVNGSHVVVTTQLIVHALLFQGNPRLIVAYSPLPPIMLVFFPPPFHTILHLHSPQIYLCDGQTWVAHVKVVLSFFQFDF